jgi:regulator of cell morphogenesis and NO signaling
MAMVTLDSTLAEVVTASPPLARELERRQLDYCCGGTRTLEQACAERGLDPAAVLEELRSASDAPSAEAWTTLGPAQLADHIETVHHLYLWDELPRLTALMTKVEGVHGAHHPELHDVATCLGELRAELEPHLRKEEQVLFPMIRELAAATSAPAFHCGTLRNPISVMMREHDQAGELLALLRELTSDHTAPADGCASYRALYEGLAELAADTHLHIHKENNVLFPMVVELEARFAS